MKFLFVALRISCLVFLSTNLAIDKNIDETYCNSYDIFNRMDSNMNDIHIHWFPFYEFIEGEFDSDLCKIKFYAYFVDVMFERGLDLQMTFSSKGEYRDNTIIFADDYTPPLDPAPQPISPMVVKKRLFTQFIQLKEAFKYKFGDRYEYKDLEPLVNNVLEYGVFHNPDKVENFLRFEYENVTMDKYYDDLRREDENLGKN